MRQERSEEARGLAIGLAGVLILSPDTLLVRLADLDLSRLLLWRGLLMAFGLIVATAIIGRFGARPGNLFLAMGRAGLATALLCGMSNFCFVLALAYTSVANTLVIIATSPLFAAIFSWIFLKERAALRTWIAIGLAAGGIAIIFSGSLGRAGGAASLMGDLAALGTAVAQAGAFVMTRRHRTINMAPAWGLGALLSAIPGAFIAGSLLVPAESVLWLALMGLLVLPLSFGLLSLAPRYIPAAEVSLLMLLETVLGPLFVWLAVGETPARETLLGGTLVVATLTVYFLLALRSRRAATPAGT